MSTIDEIMGAIGRHGDDCIRDADSASESFEALRELIAAALEDALREGAEAMRETAAGLCKQKAEREGAKAMEVEDDEPDMVDSLKATAWDFMVMESKIRSLPLPTGGRQAAEIERLRAESAGCEHAIGRLSALVETQRLLLVDVEDICGRDGHGGQFEDGESEIIDRVRAHLATMSEPESHPTTA